jgi:hypothetical protein
MIHELGGRCPVNRRWPSQSHELTLVIPASAVLPARLLLLSFRTVVTVCRSLLKPTQTTYNCSFRPASTHSCPTTHAMGCPTSIIYTCGSCVEKNIRANAPGAGVRRPNCEADSTHILPCGIGPTEHHQPSGIMGHIRCSQKHTCQSNRDETIAT